jgi:hypothetical protein
VQKAAVLLVSVVVAVVGLAACTRSPSLDPAQAPFVLETISGEVESYDRLVGITSGDVEADATGQRRRSARASLAIARPHSCCAPDTPRR